MESSAAHTIHNQEGEPVVTFHRDVLTPVEMAAIIRGTVQRIPENTSPLEVQQALMGAMAG